MTPGISTGITTQSLWTGRTTPGPVSGLMMSWVGCARSSSKFPSAATTVTPCCCAKRIARASAFQIARCSGSFLQLKYHGSAK